MIYETRRDFESMFARHRGINVKTEIKFRTEDNSPYFVYIWEGEKEDILKVRNEFKTVAKDVEMEKMEVDYKFLRNKRIDAFKELRIKEKAEERSKKGVKENDK